MKLVRLVLLVAALSLCSFQSHADILLARDANWYVTTGSSDNHPGTGWNRAPFGVDYDPSTYHTYWDSYLLPYLNVTNTFNTTGYDLSNVTISVAVDDSTTIWVNGIEILATNHLIPFGAPITITNSVLVNGTNTIEATTYGNSTLDFFGAEIAGIRIPTNGGCETPVIDHNPENVTVTIGETAYFRVYASGSNLTYQWYQNGTRLSDTNSYCDGSSIAGATSPVLTIGSAQLCNAGSYHCVVTNSCGSVTSGNGILSVYPAFLANIQFGWPNATKTGAAVAGNSGDYWTVVHGNTNDPDKIPCDEGNFTYDTLYDASGILSVGTVITSFPYIGTSFSCGDPALGYGYAAYSDPLYNGYLWTSGGGDFELIFYLPPGTYDFYFYCQYASYPASYGDKTTFYHVTSDGTVVDLPD